MFVADENIDAAIIRRLRDDGYDVVWIAETAPGTTDSAVLALAATGRRILLTADKDFSELVFRQRSAAAGVILLRLLGLSTDQKAAAVAAAIAAHRDEVPAARTPSFRSAGADGTLTA